MRDRDGFPNPMDIRRERDVRERLNRDEEYRSARGREWETPERYASDYESDDYEYQSERPRRQFGKYYGRFDRQTGVGSAAGYSGFGGPGWTSGGFGDPGYQTSGFGSVDYGQARTGGGSNYRPEYRGTPMPPYSGVRRGPHAGKGPKNYQRSDERIHEEIAERLAWDDRIDASSVEIEVASGEVTLSGSVPERQMKWMAEDVIDSIGGVKEIHNRLRVGQL
jgi:hypothetical protein